MAYPRRLPPLNALRAFEAAARHLSFTKAADELHVTPGAISQQVKALEEFVGATLFQRMNRALLLTDEAQACLPALREGFDRLAEATYILSAQESQNRLTVSAAPSFAAKWLVPRLGDFQEMHPDLDVWVSADMNPVDFAKDGVDLAIRYGSGNYPNVHVELLLEEHVFPVCSPQLMTGDTPLATPEDLKKHTLLHDASPENDESCPDWAMWLKAAGVGGVNETRGLRFNQSALALEAAISGRGVALAKGALAADDIAAGRLIKPFDLSLSVDFAYYLVCPKSKLTLQKVNQFKDWIRTLAAKSRSASS